MNVEQILALLAATFQGVRKDGLNHLAKAIALQVKTEEEAKELVGKLTAEQVKAFVSDWRKEADAEITKATQTYENGLKEKYDFVEKKPGGTPPNTPPPAAGTITTEAIQQIVTQAVADATKTLQDEITTLRGNATNAGRLELLNKELEGLPESYKSSILGNFGLMNFENEEKFNEFLATTKANVAAFQQEMADKGLSQHEKPILGAVNKDGVSAAVQDYVKEKTEGDKNTLSGKTV